MVLENTNLSRINIRNVYLTIKRRYEIIYFLLKSKDMEERVGENNISDNKEHHKAHENTQNNRENPHKNINDIKLLSRNPVPFRYEVTVVYVSILSVAS